jgi:hypothetical protein
MLTLRREINAEEYLSAVKDIRIDSTLTQIKKERYEE